MITVLHAPTASALDLDALAHDIAATGITSLEPALRAVAEAGRAAGACSVLVALVTDPAAPRVARERAFGRLAAQLASRLPAPVEHRLCA